MEAIWGGNTPMEMGIVTFEIRESILFMPLDEKHATQNKGVLKLPRVMPWSQQIKGYFCMCVLVFLFCFVFKVNIIVFYQHQCFWELYCKNIDDVSSSWLYNPHWSLSFLVSYTDSKGYSLHYIPNQCLTFFIWLENI